MTAGGDLDLAFRAPEIVMSRTPRPGSGTPCSTIRRGKLVLSIKSAEPPKSNFPTNAIGGGYDDHIIALLP
jgi:hypothetical protein